MFEKKKLGSPEAFDEANPVPTEVPFLLPHELLHELSRAGSLQEGVSKQVVSICNKC